MTIILETIKANSVNIEKLINKHSIIIDYINESNVDTNNIKDELKALFKGQSNLYAEQIALRNLIVDFNEKYKYMVDTYKNN